MVKKGLNLGLYMLRTVISKMGNFSVFSLFRLPYPILVSMPSAYQCTQNRYSWWFKWSRHNKQYTWHRWSGGPNSFSVTDCPFTPNDLTSAYTPLAHLKNITFSCVIAIYLFLWSHCECGSFFVKRYSTNIAVNLEKGRRL